MFRHLEFGELRELVTDRQEQFQYGEVRYASAGQQGIDAAQFTSSSLLHVPKSFGSRRVSRDAATASLLSTNSRLRMPDRL
jgi:hypothetical protein